MQKTGINRDEVEVKDIMTPTTGLEALRFEDVINARVGDIVETIIYSGRQHAIVTCGSEEAGDVMICGMFSTTQIGKHRSSRRILPSHLLNLRKRLLPEAVCKILSAPGIMRLFEIFRVSQPRRSIMSRKPFIYLVLLSTILIFSTAASAIGNTAMMANILMHLNHYPSDSEKTELNGMLSSDSATANEKIIAQAMINLRHSASDADKMRLKTIIDDPAAKADERSLASIVYSLNHHPSSADKAILKDMVQ